MVAAEFPPLLSERLALRRFRPEDGAPFWQYRTNEEIAKYQGDVSSFTREMAATFAREQSAQEPDVPGTWFQLAIELRPSGELIGDCGIHTREALVSVLDYVFGLLRKERVIALTDPRNVSCIRLLESLGMRREAHLVKHAQVRGEWVDDFQYGLAAEEWRGSESTV